MAQRKLVGTQLVLERRTEHAALDTRRSRGAVDLEHAVEPGHIDRH